MTATQTSHTYQLPCEVLAKFSPNGRAHFMTRARHVKQIREEAGWLAIERPIRLPDGPVQYRVVVGLRKKQLQSPPDSDNLSGHLSIKAMRDGLADVLARGSDATWECAGIATEEDPENFGFVRFEFDADR